jgi:hypothetical protein
MLAVVIGLVLAAKAPLQAAPWQYRWQAGQVLDYRVEHSTLLMEIVGENKFEISSKLTLTRRWQVQEVDPRGVATLQMSLTALRMESKKSDGQVLVYDSANPDQSTPELKTAMERYVGEPLAVLRMDAYGQVVEVKDSQFGAKSSFENELPFVLVLPGEAPKPGQGWERTYNLTLDPPDGTGEKFPAVQRYTCRAVDGALARIAFQTNVKSLPPAVADRIPLLRWLPEGEAVFDVQSGLLRSASLRIDQELNGHQGEGSKYQFQSRFTTEYVGNK